MRPAYRRIDGIDHEITLKEVIGIIRRSATMTFPLGIRSAGTIVRPLLRVQQQAKRERDVKRDYFYDYGSRTTALDRARSSDYTRYFQKLDKEMYVKLFDRTLLDAVVEFSMRMALTRATRRTSRDDHQPWNHGSWRLGPCPQPRCWPERRHLQPLPWRLGRGGAVQVCQLTMSDSTNYGIAGSNIKISATNLVVGPTGASMPAALRISPLISTR